MHLRKFFLLSHVVLCANFRDNFVLGIFENPLASACDKTKCTLPECFLNEYNIPCNLSLKETPQFVMISYHGTMRKEIFEKFKELFAYKTNPNNKPITATFFIQHAHTDYNYVSQLHSEGHEVGSFGISGLENNDWNVNDMNDFCQRLSILTTIKRSDCRGVRIPGRNLKGDNQFKIMEKNNFIYDHSLNINVVNEGDLIWPLPLVIPKIMQSKCQTVPAASCPIGSYEKIWEVPIMSHNNGNRHCTSLSECLVNKSENDSFMFLNKIFMTHYKTNRAPFSIMIDAQYITGSFHEHIEALKRFLNKLDRTDDVYIVTVSKVLEWLKNPKSKYKITSEDF